MRSFHGTTLLLCALSALFAVPNTGCGSKTGILDLSDAGTDFRDSGVLRDAEPADAEPTDMFTPEDLGPPDMGSLGPRQVRCGTAAPVGPREAMPLEAEHGEALTILDSFWQVETSPVGGAAVIDPPVGRVAQFTPDSVGDYRVRYEATDESGEVFTCTLDVEVVGVPPVAQCPMDAVAPSGEELMLTGGGTDDTMSVDLTWELVSAAPGVNAVLIALGPQVLFEADGPGEFRLRLTVTDIDGLTDTCDVGVRTTAPPVLDCPDGPLSGMSGEPTTVTVNVSDDGRVEQRWEVLSEPVAGSISARPTSGRSTTIVPPRRGDYVLRTTATDNDGLAASCDVLIRAVNAPPVALCPTNAAGLINTAIPIVGDGADDEGVVAFSWTVLSVPAGAVAGVDDAAAQSTVFRSTAPGVHTVELRVFDILGAEGACTFEVDVSAPPVVMCPSSPVAAQTRTPLSLTATATDDGTLASLQWTMIRPVASAATLSPTSGLTTNLTPDLVGDYDIEFTATDDEGLSSSCRFTVEAGPSAPVLSCPEVLIVRPLRPATIPVSVVSDAPLTSVAWTTGVFPDMSTSGGPTPASALEPTFEADIVGEYPVRLDVQDGNGFSAGCDVLIRAVADEGLRVEMFWDRPGTDMDLHVMNPEGTSWVGTNDCHFRNCRSINSLDWGAPGIEDNPRLDIDDTNGFGPENINIQEPVPGVYRVAVDAWSGAGSVTVRVYCGGSVTTAVAEVGPELLEGTGWMWRVADVDIRGVGDCTVTELDAPVVEAINGAPR